MFIKPDSKHNKGTENIPVYFILFQSSNKIAHGMNYSSSIEFVLTLLCLDILHN